MIDRDHHSRSGSVVERKRAPGNAESRLRVLLPRALALAVMAPGLALAAGDPPPLRPGLWEASTSSPRRPQPRPLVTRLCIDGQTQRQLLEQVAVAMLRLCSRNEYGMHAGRFVTNSSCTIGGSTVEGLTETTFFRDTSYHTEVVGRVTPPGRVVAPQKTVIDARHVGKCPTGMKPGDMALPNGQRLNLLQVSSVLAK